MTAKTFLFIVALCRILSVWGLAADVDPTAVKSLVNSLDQIKASGEDLGSIESVLDLEVEGVRNDLDEVDSEIEELTALLTKLQEEQSNLKDRLAQIDEAPPVKADFTWSFQDLQNPPIPSVEDDWIRNPIDAFILAKQRDQGLTHSPEADRGTLIRRLTYNLHGLPPSPEEVAQFVQEESPEAYEALVERLLASPRYGERWGRHWLDVVHYADTHGYDKDKRRPHAWPYRDYVIESLNQDKPFDRFAKEQIAGDVLYPDDPMGVVATGFVSSGPWDFVGHVELREGTKDKKITRNLDRDDMVMNTLSTFMSLTVHCARCHDHKFDPIEQEDYYSLQSVFAGVDRANRPYHRDPEVYLEWKQANDRRSTLEEAESRQKEWIQSATSGELIRVDGELAEIQDRMDEVQSEKSPSNGYHSGIEQEPNTEKWVQIDLAEVQPIGRVVLFPARPVDFPDTPGFGFPTRFRIESSTQETFENPVTLVDHTQEDFPNPGDNPFEAVCEPTDARYVRILATRLWERTDDFVFALGEAQVFSGSQLVSEGRPVSALDTIDSGLWNTRHLVDGYDSRARVNDGDDEILDSLRAQREDLAAERSQVALSLLPEASKEIMSKTDHELQEIRERMKGLPEPQWVYSAANDFKREGSFRPATAPRPIHLLPRGDIGRPGKEVKPGGVRALHHEPAVFEIKNPNHEGERRAALANWIAHPDNAFFWRSIVNRVWHYHFGRGIVDTPNDFGKMGSQPTHPELLDWLATSFRENGGSLKWLHRLIVTSSAYRQVSTGDEANDKIDSGNQYLWRMNRTRLDAESLRDSVLAVSGKLDLSMGGPGYDLFGFIDDHSPHYLYHQHDADDPKTLRRTIYRFIVRSVPDPFMECLDCADPSQNVPVRNRTLTPLQSLALLNNPFMVRMTEHLAARLKSEAQGESERIDRAYEICLARQPTEEEHELLLEYATEFGLPAACRVLLNSNEFLFVD